MYESMTIEKIDSSIFMVEDMRLERGEECWKFGSDWRTEQMIEYANGNK